ncbi:MULTISPECIES: helix-turn-helix domain-containing protein [Kitasatospora]|uniref:helix-turn-helix domain-containing protein n=1 Tax=Kitasatospora TaxID=2063 RepID=UPI000C70E9AC|nr:helix-turn-helix transcriptional regulator [Kitasatospora sp. GP30]MDH6144890.1 transcriptional regulator with XRE-family HTH domain [Kitasatospora sp. GP30]
MRRTELDPSAGPGAAFGVQLRRSREALGLSQVTFGKQIGYSDTFISCVERATRNPSYDFAVKSDKALLTGGTLELMWWSLRHKALLEGFPEYAAQEAKAAEIRHFELGIIPGLLQTPEYAKAFAMAAVRRGSVTKEEAEERLEFLASRQRRLERADGPLLHVVLDEGAIRRPVGGATVMRRQFRRLEELSERPNVTIQIAPFSLAEELPFTMVVTLLTMSDRSVAAYSECQLRGFLERDGKTARTWERQYHQLQVEALSKGATLEMLRKA